MHAFSNMHACVHAAGRGATPWRRCRASRRARSGTSCSPPTTAPATASSTQWCSSKRQPRWVGWDGVAGGAFSPTHHCAHRCWCVVAAGCVGGCGTALRHTRCLASIPPAPRRTHGARAARAVTCALGSSSWQAAAPACCPALHAATSIACRALALAPAAVQAPAGRALGGCHAARARADRARPGARQHARGQLCGHVSSS